MHCQVVPALGRF